MSFQDPIWFVAIAAVILIFAVHFRMPQARLRMASLEGYGRLARKSQSWLIVIPRWLRLCVLILLLIALARPQEGMEQTKVREEGIDIVLAVDVSTSMLAEDFTLDGKRVNRLAIVKDVVKSFVEQRSNDRIGIVVFAGRPYIQCPLTLDHPWLLQQLEGLEIGMIEDGTAIGEALGTSLNRLRDSKAKSRVVILLTDGINNAGSLSPEAAADLARSLKVKVYTIGAGTKGLAPYPARDLFGRKVYQQVKLEVDDAMLQAVATKTGARYFRATDTDSLRDTYGEIDRLEQTEFEQPTFMVYQELYRPWVMMALLCLGLEVFLAQTFLRVLP